ncbi:hypothetical protein FACS1894200_13760 [Spirochaetia bacterium]|nr:hypothetical protein FACS1894200_13760 [Spirochaetia bacterium]
MELIKGVLLSWQVIFIGIAFIIFYLIVSNVARMYRRPRHIAPAYKKKKKKAAKSAAEEIVTTDDDLGLTPAEE